MLLSAVLTMSALRLFLVTCALNLQALVSETSYVFPMLLLCMMVTIGELKSLTVSGYYSAMTISVY
ncbi:hypothetical protein ASF60_18940 [Methylobacterium sp. Leaf113]|nr:hypothetical protein ASF60_18940 [Methylobacterium sp. Leaf113]